MREKHSVLLLKIGTFAEEDEAYELLNSLSMFLPLVVMVTWVPDALLAAIYLKWFHPWKIILQDVSFLWFDFFLLQLLPLRSQTSGRSKQGITQGQSRQTRWFLYVTLEFGFFLQQLVEDPARDVSPFATSHRAEVRRKSRHKLQNEIRRRLFWEEGWMWKWS